jgi:hypothetical protein
MRHQPFTTLFSWLVEYSNYRASNSPYDSPLLKVLLRHQFDIYVFDLYIKNQTIEKKKKSTILQQCFQPYALVAPHWRIFDS